VKHSAKILLLACVTASAAHAEKSVVLLRGMGLTNCAEFSTELHNQDYTIGTTQWIYGHWSAQNRYLALLGGKMKDIQDSTLEPDPLVAQILAVCKAEPNLQLIQAADRIFDRLPDLTAGNLP
jgi:hypothetical protein